MSEYTLQNEDDLDPICQNLAQKLEPGTCIHLNGPLGAGKTTFTRHLGQALNSEDPINSPTYSLIQSYTCNHPKIKTIHHMDLYRLKTQTECDTLDLDQYLNDPKSICIIEWSNKWKTLPSKKNIHINLKFPNGSNSHPNHRFLRVIFE